MIELSAQALDVLTRSHRRHIMVESWRGSELLSDAVPIDAAMEETDRSLSVPERVTFTVPRYYSGTNWTPTVEDHPLAANGQRLRVQLGIEVGNDVVEWFQRGLFVITSANAQGDAVTVEAEGLLRLPQEARFVSPFQPSGTLVSTLRKLIEPALTVVVDSGLTDRSVPSDINWDEDRLGAIHELIDAWPADYRVTEGGYLYVFPATDPTTADLTLTDGVGGTVIQATGTSTRDGGFNVVVAQGTDSSGAQIQSTAVDLEGPKRHGGPFNPLPVPYKFYSPLLTTQAQCAAAAATRLRNLKRQAGREFLVEMVPHPGVQAGDAVSVTTDDYTDLLCTVEALSLPYKADGGSQTLRVRSLE